MRGIGPAIFDHERVFGFEGYQRPVGGFLFGSIFFSFPLMVVMIFCAGFYGVFHLVAHLKNKKAAKA